MFFISRIAISLPNKSTNRLLFLSSGIDAQGLGIGIASRLQLLGMFTLAILTISITPNKGCVGVSEFSSSSILRKTFSGILSEKPLDRKLVTIVK